MTVQDPRLGFIPLSLILPNTLISDNCLNEVGRALSIRDVAHVSASSLRLKMKVLVVSSSLSPPISVTVLKLRSHMPASSPVVPVNGLMILVIVAMSRSTLLFGMILMLAINISDNLPLYR